MNGGSLSSVTPRPLIDPYPCRDRQDKWTRPEDVNQGGAHPHIGKDAPEAHDGPDGKIKAADQNHQSLAKAEDDCEGGQKQHRLRLLPTAEA